MRDWHGRRQGREISGQTKRDILTERNSVGAREEVVLLKQQRERREVGSAREEDPAQERERVQDQRPRRAGE